MKKILITALSLISLSLVAHVEDGDLFINIGKIEKIVITKSLNIKPNTKYTNLGPKGNCWIRHDSVNYDRSITSPKELQFNGIFIGNEDDLKGHIGFKILGLSSASTLTCQLGHRSWHRITIKDVKMMLEGYVQIKLASTVEME